MTTHTHPIPPIYNEDSRILILGSFPSVKSREAGFYYAHPNNRFWKTIAAVTGTELPLTVNDKIDLLLSSHIALWDVIAECDIAGSSDSSIRNVTANDIKPILESSRIESVFTNGKTADALYRKYIRESCGFDAVPLPSTSPANASCSLDRLIEEWRIIRKYI